MPKGIYRGRTRLTESEKISRRKSRDVAYYYANHEKRLSYRSDYVSRNKDKVKSASAAWRLSNKDKIKSKNAEYAALHKEELKKYQSEYRSQNREKARATTAAWRAAHLERAKASCAAYYASHPEIWKRVNAKRRAILRGASVGDVKAIEAWEKKWRARSIVKCHWCDKRIKTQLAHIDHVVPLAKLGSHTLDNLCVSCPNCNLRKHDKLPMVWNANLVQPLLFW